MINDELISVVIPVYNCEERIKNILDAVLNQTYNNLEVIVIDDGSTDTTGTICDSLAERDHRLKCFHRDNQGVSASRDFGVSIAKGKYLAFIDADDYIVKDYFQVLYKAITHENADIAALNYIEIEENEIENYLYKEDLMKYVDSKHGHFGYEIFSGEKELLKRYLLHKSFCYVVWGKLYRTEFIKDYKFPGLKYTEDTNYFVHLSEGNPKVVLLPFCGYLYLQNTDSVTHQTDLLPRIIATLFTSEYVRFVCKEKYNDLYLISIDRELNYIFSAFSLLVRNKRKYSKITYNEYIVTLREYLSEFNIYNIIACKKMKYLMMVLFKISPECAICAFELMLNVRSKGRK